MSAPGERLLLRAVEVEGRPVDVLVEEGRVIDVGPGLRPTGNLVVVDGEGGALLPGLHDHHVHLLAMAARAAGTDLDALPDASAVDAAVRAAAASARPDPGAVRSGAAGATGQRTDPGEGWVRVAGYDEHRHGPMDRHRLDALAPGVAVRVQHRSGLGWVLSGAALERVGVVDGAGRPLPGVPDGVEIGPDGAPTGWLHRLDGWLGDRVPRTDLGAGLAEVARQLAAMGVTGVTDATVALGPARLEVLRAARHARALPQDLVLLGEDDPAAVEGWARLGPAKLLADEVLGLDPDHLATRIDEHHRAGRAVAIHAVTRTENVAAVAALAAAGTRPGDRIEHGSVLPHDLDGFLAAHGVTVVVQPALVHERGDHHLAEVDADDLPILHRHASLLAAGVRVGVGSDAPVTSADPWAGIAAATTRRTRSGAEVGVLAEAVPPRLALGWYLADPLDPGGPERRVEPGAPADLCLLDRPLDEVLREPHADRVRATWVRGRLEHP